MSTITQMKRGVSHSNRPPAITVLWSGGAWEAACRTIAATCSSVCNRVAFRAARRGESDFVGGETSLSSSGMLTECSRFSGRCMGRWVSALVGALSLCPNFVDLVFLNLDLDKRTGSSVFDGTTSSNCRNFCFCRTRNCSSSHLRPQRSNLGLCWEEDRAPLCCTRHTDLKEGSLL
jgi:hypothetical protein